MIHGAIFDVDGTLLDSMPIWWDAGKNYLNSLNIEAEEGLSELLYTMSLNQAAEYINIHYKLNKTTEIVINELIDLVKYFYKYEAPLKPGAKEFLDLLKENNIPMNIATASDTSYLKMAFDRLGLNDYFCNIHTCVDYNTNKNEPDIYLIAAKDLGCGIDEIYVFEDVLFGIKTAHNAGFKVAGVYDESSKNHAEEIKTLSDIFITDYNNLMLSDFK